jgi:hypothetical protein
MLPTEAFTATFDEPSSGSNTRRYSPREDERVQLPARARIAAPFLDQELGERRTVGEHDILTDSRCA